ncbi:uncharacterized protein TRIVIDRAFT_67951 [Trichoderma virens Gv29-8]|uniref:Uncharacterized protein n=1 Tax=Hypocrea virens (strain Gv29-8 / FGSC 10586) TaxID=413071 RepID=G9N1A7_HYPVG|nr:uncharacterized protein TRIVIDRAFT_67951 [Trichoderma virens Gv29-8]EHK19538.1 hypothetical protein TRIVIDRAFT_67951 [Trichoderma virens Gv29-8]
MLPNHLWPILFFVCLLISIAILACLTFTVFSIILDRRNSTREDSPAERYYTFEGSVNGAFEDDVPRRAAGMFGIPQKFLKQRGNVPATSTRRDSRHNQPAGSSHDHRRRASKPLRTPARRAMFNTQHGGTLHAEGVPEHGSFTPRTLSVAGSQGGDYGDDITSVASSLVAHAPSV